MAETTLMMVMIDLLAVMLMSHKEMNIAIIFPGKNYLLEPILPVLQQLFCDFSPLLVVS